MKLIVYNRTNSISVLWLEPVANAYEIQPDTHITVQGDFISASDGYGEIEIGKDNQISLYMDLDATVWKDGEQLKPNPKY